MSIKQLQQFAYDCVLVHAKFDKFIKQYTITLSDLPDFDQHEFASLILANDDSLASEATGADNGLYANHMLPALLGLLKHSTDKEKQTDFVEQWRDGVTAYVNDQIDELLQEAVQDYNADQDLLYLDDPSPRRDSTDLGVHPW